MLERNQKTRLLITTILFVGFAVRLALPVAAFLSARDSAVFAAPDTASYIRCAEEMLRGGGFASGGEPEIVRTPGYPLFLVSGVLLGHVAPVTIFLQAALGCLTVWLVYRIAFILTGSRGAAGGAGILMAFEPLSVLYCCILLSETLFAALLTLFLYFFILSVKTDRPRETIASALALSAAVYVRPIAYWLPLLMALFLAAAVLLRKEGSRRRLWKPIAFFTLCAALVGAWQIRNKMETGYGGFSAITDYYLYFYQGAAVVAAERGRSYYDVQREMGYHDLRRYRARHPEQAAMTRARLFTAMGREGRAIILSHPVIFSKIYVEGMMRTLLDPCAVDYLKLFRVYPEGGGLLGELVDRGPLATVLALARRRPRVFVSNLVLGIVLLVYLGLALPAFFRRSCRNAPFAAVVTTGIYILLLSGGANALGRFRHPLMPIICVCAGCGVDLLLRAKRNG